MRYEEFYKIIHSKDCSCWEFLEARPRGKIINRKQYDYVVWYGNKVGINANGGKNLCSYEDAIGKYIALGNYFGGGSFYFYMSEEPEHINPIYECGKIASSDGIYEDFSYGKYGEIIE